MTTSTSVSRRNGTKALPPAHLPGAQNWNPLSHKGLRGNKGAGLRPTVKSAERGIGAAKKMTGECGVREKAGRAHGSGPLSNMTLKVLGHSRTKQYKLLQKPPPRE